MSNIVVHHLEQSRSIRILWLLEELELSYELVEYERDPATMRAPAALGEVHPLGRSPVVVLDGLVLAESGAIIEHLLETVGEGRLVPEDPEDRVRHRFFMHYAEGSVMPPLLVRLITSKIRTVKVPFFIRPIVRRIADKVDDGYTRPEIQNHFDHIERSLGDKPWFGGAEISGADMQMLYAVVAGLERGGQGERCPNTRDWLARVRERPAFQRAEERGGPVEMPSSGKR